MIILETAFGVLSWNTDTQALEIKWIGNLSSEDYRTILEKGLEIVRQNGIKRWLGDATLLESLSQEDENWSAQDFGIRMVAAGISRIALILPENELTKMIVNGIVTMVIDQTGLETGYFSNLEKGREWIKRSE